jgi:hypothetical protein
MCFKFFEKRKKEKKNKTNRNCSLQKERAIERSMIFFKYLSLFISHKRGELVEKQEEERNKKKDYGR